nr:MAG TPA: hypothetical protein [Caudoviricetes sp.]
MQSFIATGHFGQWYFYAYFRERKELRVGHPINGFSSRMTKTK